MAQSENPAALAILFILGLVALAIFNVGQRGGIDGTLLGWFTSRPELFTGIIVFLVIVGILLNIAQEL